MKSSLVCLLALLSAVSGRAAEASAVPSCCAPENAPAKPAAAPCCTEVAPAAAYSAKSLYQLDAKWTDDAGRTVGLGLHRGRPVILAMFFSSCEYACPVLVNDIQRLQKLLPEDVRRRLQVVLVSFDVARDTPEALRAFRARMNLDDGWTLLRGDTMAVQDLAMLLGVKFKQDARGQFAHSNLFAVLNAEGEVAHQHAGLMGDVSEAAKAVAALVR